MFAQVVADEYWRGYLSRNNSVIVELFTGQFKSKTKCPQCKKVRQNESGGVERSSTMIDSRNR